MRRTALLSLLAAGLLTLLATGCFNPFRPQVVAGVAYSEPAPRPTSPQGALQLLRWCWVNRNIAVYEELFTEDFRFFFADLEAADNPPVFRDDEIAIAQHLFVDGSATEPRAKRIDLEFSSSLIPIPDPRPGRGEEPRFKAVNTSVSLRADLGDAIFDVTGDVTFYLSRGDTALIPNALKERGFGKDQNRWYIEGWEDKTTDGASHAVIERALRVAMGSAPWDGRGATLAAGATPSAGAAHPAKLMPKLGAAAAAISPETRVSLGTLKLMFR